MKQIIVMVAMVILGIAIAGMVFSFKGPAEDISQAAAGGIRDAVTEEAMNRAGS